MFPHTHTGTRFKCFAVMAAKEKLRSVHQSARGKTTTSPKAVPSPARAVSKPFYMVGLGATVREPLLVLDEKLCVVSANRAFYRTFKTSAREVERRLIYELSQGRWNLPALRKLLEKILSQDAAFEGFAVGQEFPGVGFKSLLLNARRLKREPGAADMILLAIEVVADKAVAIRKPRPGQDRTA